MIGGMKSVKDWVNSDSRSAAGMEVEAQTRYTEGEKIWIFDH